MALSFSSSILKSTLGNEQSAVVGQSEKSLGQKIDYYKMYGIYFYFKWFKPKNHLISRWIVMHF